MGGRGSISKGSIRSYYGILINTDNDTRNLNSYFGETYKPERVQLHDKIVSRMTRQSHKFTKRETKTAHLVVDETDSFANTTLKSIVSGGKSKYQHQVISNYSVARNIPETRKLINTYRTYKDPFTEKAYPKVRREVATINSKLVNSLISNNRAVVYRSTFSNPTSTSALISRLKKSGYEVHVYQSSLGMNKSNTLSVSILKKLGASYTVYDAVTHSTVNATKKPTRGTQPTQIKRLSTPEEEAKKRARATELREKRAREKAERDFEKLWKNISGGK